MSAYQKDLSEFCAVLNRHNVEYMVIGGVAVNLHGYARATGDVDIWYSPTDENFLRLLDSIKEFGFDTNDITGIKNLAEKGFIRIPLDRFFIELLSVIDGRIPFDDALKRAEVMTVENVSIPVIGYDDLIQNKIMSRRPKDIEDITQLERRRSSKK